MCDDVKQSIVCKIKAERLSGCIAGSLVIIYWDEDQQLRMGAYDS